MTKLEQIWRAYIRACLAGKRNPRVAAFIYCRDTFGWSITEAAPRVDAVMRAAGHL